MFIDPRRREERGGGREREGEGERRRERREKHPSVASRACPNQLSIPQPFGAWDDVPTN